MAFSTVVMSAAVRLATGSAAKLATVVVAESARRLSAPMLFCVKRALDPTNALNLLNVVTSRGSRLGCDEELESCSAGRCGE